MVNLYSCLSPIMQLATGGIGQDNNGDNAPMLNFGYWTENTTSPIQAQKQLCTLVGKTGEFDSAKTILDVGSGLCGPAIQWRAEYDGLDISCININLQQLQNSSKSLYGMARVNSTATTLPFGSNTVDRVVALESAHHFKPLGNFVSEARRVLKKDGLLVLAIPVAVPPNENSNSSRNDSNPNFHTLIPFGRLGLLSITWFSEHYSINYIRSVLEKSKFQISSIQKIGSFVYEPLANYYAQNRQSLRQLIQSQYPSYVEKILFRSLLKMNQSSKDKIIDYIIVKCRL